MNDTRPLRIVTISDHVRAPSGFGIQHRYMVEGLAKLDAEVFSVGLWDDRPLSREKAGYWSIGAGKDGATGFAASWPHILRWLQPHVLITLGDPHMYQAIYQQACENGSRAYTWLHWYPVDSPTYNRQGHPMFLSTDGIVAMTLFGLNVLKPALLGRVPLSVVPHCVDTDIFRPPTEDERGFARTLLSQSFETDLSDKRILLCHDTNQWRKASYVLVEMLCDLPDDVVLLMHCAPQPRTGSRGYHLQRLAHEVGVKDRVFFTGHENERPTLRQDQLARLLWASDLRVSATMGEGFGICHIEAMACGLPSAVTDCTTSREILGDSGAYADVAHWRPMGPVGLRRACVDKGHLVEIVEYLLDHPEERATMAQAGVQRVRDNFTVPAVQAAWRDVVKTALENYSWQ